MTDSRRRVEADELRSLAFDAMPSEVAVLDADGTILETNGCWTTFAEDNGIAFHPDMIGQNYLDTCDAAEGDETATEAASGIRSIIDGERESFQFEYPCHSPDERRWFMMRALPFEYQGSRCVLVVHTDITDRREAELAVEERNDQLTLLTDVLSHDLRNPLNVALGRAELLDGDDEQVAAVRSSLERMNTIVEDALVLARKTDVEQLSAVDLPTVVRDAWSHVATADATLTVEPIDRIEADESLLSQLLENLFRNAVEHSSTSPPSHAREDAVEHAGSDVTVVVGPLDDASGFFVADDGPGVPAPDRDEVFEPGYTTNADEGGTGLGLAIVDRIADAHGWSVRVTDGDDGGARFEFSGVTSAS
ncbi:PAS fold-containing protein [Halomicrobium zhouii]|uniref:histidine kinase n=1 Tax=Halomicrobium zhouii TaxID=767519 RepID=A0A1I6KAC6_9EURY|nr:PAS domain-containing sensor histidine kinase [Halomicrobium zhouii]SFR87988.1 PAS fold-containing protein [Halomicrobium zhouii]